MFTLSSHATSGSFVLQMTSAAPTGVATGFPPAYSHAFNRADATAGAVALRLEGVVDGSRYAQQDRAPGVHESSIVPLVLEDMVVMNVVARLPPCFTRRRIPEEAAKKEHYLALSREAGRHVGELGQRLAVELGHLHQVLEERVEGRELLLARDQVDELAAVSLVFAFSACAAASVWCTAANRRPESARGPRCRCGLGVNAVADARLAVFM